MARKPASCLFDLDVRPISQSSVMWPGLFRWTMLILVLASLQEYFNTLDTVVSFFSTLQWFLWSQKVKSVGFFNLLQTHRAAGLENALQYLGLGIACAFCTSGEQPRCCLKQKFEARVTIPCHVYNRNVTSNREIYKKTSNSWWIQSFQRQVHQPKSLQIFKRFFWSFVSFVLCLWPIVSQKWNMGTPNEHEQEKKFIFPPPSFSFNVEHLKACRVIHFWAPSISTWRSCRCFVAAAASVFF